MADIKWIKITIDMFDNRKIKHLRRLPDGNNIVLIWVMLLTMAGRCNSGGMVFLTENIPYTPKMLADELDFEENTVQLALNALQQLNMIVMDSGFFSIAGWTEYQNIEGLDKIREQNRLRKAAQRERQKALAEPSQHCHVMSRDCHAIDIDKEKEEEKDVLPKGNTKQKPPKNPFGDYGNVKLTQKEYENLRTKYGVEVLEKAIAFLDAYIEEKGYKSKSHNLAIQRWVIDAVSTPKPRQYGRKEVVPKWMNKEEPNLDREKEDMERIKRLMRNNPDLSARVDALKERLGGGLKDGLEND